MVKVMTDKQMQFIAWLITTATDKCQTMDEVREMNKEIRKHSTGFKEEADSCKNKQGSDPPLSAMAGRGT